MHGTEDSLIRPVYTELSVSVLRQFGMDVDMCDSPICFAISLLSLICDPICSCKQYLAGNGQCWYCRYALQGWDHGDDPFRPKDLQQPTASHRLRAERLGISSSHDISDAAHYAANWLNEAVRKSVERAADAEAGQPCDIPHATSDDSEFLTAGLLAQGRPAVHRLHETEVQASLPVFNLSGQRSGVLGGLSDIEWQLPMPRMRWDLDTTGASRAALKTNLFTAIALHDESTVEFIIKSEKFPIESNALRTDRGRTPLHAAVLAESSVVTSLLITHGVDPNVQDDDGNTPLTLCLLPDNELLAMGDAPLPRLDTQNRRGTFALPLVSPRRPGLLAACLVKCLVGLSA